MRSKNVIWGEWVWQSAEPHRVSWAVNEDHWTKLGTRPHLHSDLPPSGSHFLPLSPSPLALPCSRKVCQQELFSQGLSKDVQIWTENLLVNELFLLYPTVHGTPLGIWSSILYTSHRGKATVEKMKDATLSLASAWTWASPSVYLWFFLCQRKKVIFLFLVKVWWEECNAKNWCYLNILLRCIHA